MSSRWRFTGLFRDLRIRPFLRDVKHWHWVSQVLELRRFGGIWSSGAVREELELRDEAWISGLHVMRICMSHL